MSVLPAKPFNLLRASLLASMACVLQTLPTPSFAESLVGSWANCDGQQAKCAVDRAPDDVDPQPARASSDNRFFNWLNLAQPIRPASADPSPGWTTHAEPVSASEPGDAAARWTTEVSVKEPVDATPTSQPAPVRLTSPAMLRRQPHSAETMAAGPGHADGACRELSSRPADARLPFSVTVDGQSTNGSLDRNAADSQHCIDQALARAEVQIRYDGLDTEPRLNVVAAPDAAVKGSGVVFITHANYALQLARGEIRIFAKGTTVRQAPLAIVPVEQGLGLWTVPADIREQIVFHRGSLKDDTPATTTTERPVSAPLGATPSDTVRDQVVYVLRVYDDGGRFDETAPKTLDLANLRGGITHANELMAVYNGNALEVHNIPIAGGAVLVSGRNVPPGHTVTVLGIPVPVDETGAFAVRQIVAPGPHDVSVAIASPTGTASVFERGIVVPDHDYFYVAMADITAGKNGTTGPTNAALLNPE